jgi:hypothetical protein
LTFTQDSPQTGNLGLCCATSSRLKTVDGRVLPNISPLTGLGMFFGFGFYKNAAPTALGNGSESKSKALCKYCLT